MVVSKRHHTAKHRGGDISSKDFYKLKNAYQEVEDIIYKESINDADKDKLRNLLQLINEIEPDIHRSFNPHRNTSHDLTKDIISNIFLDLRIAARSVLSNHTNVDNITHEEEMRMEKYKLYRDLPRIIMNKDTMNSHFVRIRNIMNSHPDVRNLDDLRILLHFYRKDQFGIPRALHELIEKARRVNPTIIPELREELHILYELIQQQMPVIRDAIYFYGLRSSEERLHRQHSTLTRIPTEEITYERSRPLHRNADQHLRGLPSNQRELQFSRVLSVNGLPNAVYAYDNDSNENSENESGIGYMQYNSNSNNNNGNNHVGPVLVRRRPRIAPRTTGRQGGYKRSDYKRSDYKRSDSKNRRYTRKK